MAMDLFNFETFHFGHYWLLLLAIAHVGMEIPRSTFSEKGDQLQNRDIIFFSQIFGPVFS